MTPKEQAFVNAIAQQRDQALNAIASVRADLFEAMEKIKALEILARPISAETLTD